METLMVHGMYFLKKSVAIISKMTTLTDNWCPDYFSANAFSFRWFIWNQSRLMWSVKPTQTEHWTSQNDISEPRIPCLTVRSNHFVVDFYSTRGAASYNQRCALKCHIRKEALAGSQGGDHRDRKKDLEMSLLLLSLPSHSPSNKWRHLVK